MVKRKMPKADKELSNRTEIEKRMFNIQLYGTIILLAGILLFALCGMAANEYRITHPDCKLTIAEVIGVILVPIIGFGLAMVVWPEIISFKGILKFLSAIFAIGAGIILLIMAKDFILGLIIKFGCLA